MIQPVLLVQPRPDLLVRHLDFTGAIGLGAWYPGKSTRPDATGAAAMGHPHWTTY